MIYQVVPDACPSHAQTIYYSNWRRYSSRPWLQQSYQALHKGKEVAVRTERKTVGHVKKSTEPGPP